MVIKILDISRPGSFVTFAILTSFLFQTKFRANDPSIFARVQDQQDGAEPCTNSIAALNLLRMAILFDSKQYRIRAENILLSSSEFLKEYPFVLPKMCIALYAYEHPPIEVLFTVIVF